MHSGPERQATMYPRRFGYPNPAIRLLIPRFQEWSPRHIRHRQGCVRGVVITFSNFKSVEPVSKCSILFEIKKGENFNHRNIFNISRIKIWAWRRDRAKGGVLKLALYLLLWNRCFVVMDEWYGKYFYISSPETYPYSLPRQSQTTRICQIRSAIPRFKPAWIATRRA